MPPDPTLPPLGASVKAKPSGWNAGPSFDSDPPESEDLPDEVSGVLSGYDVEVPQGANYFKYIVDGHDVDPVTLVAIDGQ